MSDDALRAALHAIANLQVYNDASILPILLRFAQQQRAATWQAAALKFRTSDNVEFCRKDSFGELGMSKDAFAEYCEARAQEGS